MCAREKNETVKVQIAELVLISLGEKITKRSKLFSEANKLLRLIITDSTQAINFISLLEDEFQLEIDDDDINLDFFTNIDIMADIIIRSKGKLLPNKNTINI